MNARLVVFACGNTSRSDDALGPRLLERVAQQQFAGVVTIEDFQLQIEHALDLRDADLALFVDAATGGAAPIVFYEVTSRAPVAAATHALEPAGVLDVYRHAVGGEPPPAFVLSVRGDDFRLRDGMSELATERLEAAWPFLRDLCAQPDAMRWRRLAAEFSVSAD
jgi:hydrogenase maturation protease